MNHNKKEKELVISNGSNKNNKSIIPDSIKKLLAGFYREMVCIDLRPLGPLENSKKGGMYVRNIKKGFSEGGILQCCDRYRSSIHPLDKR